MSNLLLFVWNFLTKTLPSILARPSAPEPSPSPTAAPTDKTTVLARWLLSQTEALGPMPGTLGVVHAIDAATATNVAGVLVKYAAKYDLKLSLLAAYVHQESLGDPLAVDPNANSLPADADDSARFLACDFGLFQLNGGETLVGLPSLKGMTIAEMTAKAYDPDFSTDTACAVIVANMRAIANAVAIKPSLLAGVPGKNVAIPQANAYNAGVTGTIQTMSSPNPNLSYGEAVVALATSLESLLD